MGLGMDVVCIGFEKTLQIEAVAAQALLKILRFASHVSRCSLTISTAEPGYLTRLEAFSTRRASLLIEHYRSPDLLRCIDRVFVETEARLLVICSVEANSR